MSETRTFLDRFNQQSQSLSQNGLNEPEQNTRILTKGDTAEIGITRTCRIVGGERTKFRRENPVVLEKTDRHHSRGNRNSTASPILRRKERGFVQAGSHAEKMVLAHGSVAPTSTKEPKEGHRTMKEEPGVKAVYVH